MVLGEVVTAIGGYGLELMVGEERTQLSSGGTAGAVEFIAGIFHLIHLEYGLQAAFVEGALWATRGRPSILGAISAQTFGKTSAFIVSSRVNP